MPTSRDSVRYALLDFIGKVRNNRLLATPELLMGYVRAYKQKELTHLHFSNDSGLAPWLTRTLFECEHITEAHEEACELAIFCLISDRLSIRGGNRMKKITNIPKYVWNERQLFEKAIEEYNNKVSHKINWIMHRQEKNGVGRSGRWGIVPFNLDDLIEKINSREHPMNKDDTKYYDWVFGGTNFIWRLEFNEKNFKAGKRRFLKTYVIYKENEQVLKEIEYELLDNRTFRVVGNIVASVAG